MALIDKTNIETVAITHEPGETVGLRKLSGVEMDEASDVSMDKLIDKYGDQLGRVTASVQGDAAKVAAERDTIEARRASYDPTTLFKYALMEWSYDAEVNEENIAQLDGETRDWLWGQIVERNTRPPESVSD